MQYIFHINKTRDWKITFGTSILWPICCWCEGKKRQEMVLAETAAPANTSFLPLEYLSPCNFQTKLHHIDYRIPDVARWGEQLSPSLWNPSPHHPQPWPTALLLPAGLFPLWFPHEHFHPKYILHFYWSSPDVWPFISWHWIHMPISAGHAGCSAFPCHTFHASLPMFQVTSHP